MATDTVESERKPGPAELLRGSFEALIADWSRQGPADGLDRAQRTRLLEALIQRAEGERAAGRDLDGFVDFDDVLLLGREAAVLRRVALQQWARARRPPDSATLAFHSALDGLVLELTAQTIERQRAAQAEARAWRDRTHRLVEGGPVGIITWTREGRILEANDAFLRLVGYSRAELDAGELHWTELTPPGFEEVDRRAQEELQRTGRSLGEKQYVRKDGRRVWVVLGSAKLTEDGSEAVSFVLDRTQQKEAEAFRDRVLGIVGHDLRNPLAVIRSSVALLGRKRRGDTELERSLHRVDAACVRMERMISDLLDFTRGAAGGGIPVRPQPMDLQPILQQLAGDTAVLHPDRAFELRSSGELTGTWDPSRVVQALGNLLGNAFKHGRRDRPVALRAWEEGPEVCVSIHNEGAPISPALLPVIFEPFRQEEGRSARSGLGLGLYIAHEIARAHGGRIEVVSTADEGTTFTIRLPRQAPEALQPEA